MRSRWPILDESPGGHELVPGWVSFLAEAGFAAVHWSEVGSGSATDNELMQWAAERDHIVLTADLDFGAILAATQGIRPSVVQVRGEILSPRVIGGAVVRAIRQARQDLLDGALISVDAARARVRILPLRDEQT